MIYIDYSLHKRVEKRTSKSGRKMAASIFGLAHVSLREKSDLEKIVCNVKTSCNDKTR